ncbi:O-antigen polymerase [Erwinia aphidicola]|uniref:O-antigen polymerase n=1 Tax=Erwinia aphidicola TaxID=68334 RepID=UPI003CFA74B9
MSLLAIVFLFLVPCAFLKFGMKKGLTYPATLFSFVFLIVLLMALLSHYFFGYYYISLETYAIYGLGNISFIMGSLLITSVQRTSPRRFEPLVNGRGKWLNIFFHVLLLLCLLYSPVIYDEFMAVTPNGPISIRILRLREYGLTQQVYSTLTNNFIIISTFLVMLSAYLFSRKKIRFPLFALSYLLFAYYNFLTGTRAAIILITVAIMFIYLVCAEKKSKLLLVLILVSAFFLGAVVAIYMGKDGMDRDANFSDNISKVIENYFSYTVQGVILFDNYIVDRNKISENWDVLSGAKGVANKIAGADLFDINTKFSDFSYFSKDKDGNVYTIYFSVYPLYGLIGVFTFFVLYGAFCSFVYHRANYVFVIILCYISATLCLNVFNEQVFTNFIYTIKLLAFISLCRYFEKIK